MKLCLIVDDSRVVRKLIRQIMEALQFKVIEAENGANALEICRAGMPDAILLDWNMPEMDGITFLRALRQEPKGGEPKVVFCTTENDFKHLAAAMDAGADEYVMKPFDEAILTSKLEQAGLMATKQ